MVRYDPQKSEEQILKFWKDKNIFKKLRKRNEKGPVWSFIDGPITANNSMGVHHGWGRTLKDVYQRYKAMNGYHQRYQNGFDCQGLWVEREVEKKNGFKSKKDIREYGVKKFVKDCRARVVKYSKRITKQSIRLGQWMDWDNSYYTMSDKSNEYKWMFLKECYKKGWLYKGVDVVPWCPRCSSTESRHAILTEGYEDREDTAIYMQFPVKGKKNEYFLVWTTTPWTVSANVALAVHPDIYYVRAKKGKKIFVLAEECAEAVLGKNYTVLSKFLGADLVGQAYKMPYEDLPAQKKGIISGAKSDKDTAPAPHIVVEWEDVSDEEGTGMVHIAPGCGPEDYELGKRERLPAPSPLDSVGKYKKGYGWLSRKYASKMNEKVVKDLKKKGFILKTEKYTHRYPHCTRCRTPLLFRLIPAWYISMDKIRKKLTAENKKINWVPETGQKYEENWLKNMSDWLISRKRYWGLPLPIWECDCGHVEVIGSKKELKKKAVSGYSKLKELHRPWADKVKIKCPKCGKKVKRIKDTGDVWFDAGSVSFFTLDWLTNKKKFNKWYPADFVTECGPGQYRLWFYAMLLWGVTLTNKRPFKTILTHELIKDEKGKEMHKSWGNAIWFDDVVNKVGADVMRWFYANNDNSKEMKFGWNVLRDKKKSLNVLWNFVNYVSSNLPNKKPSKPKKLSLKGRWIISRLESLKLSATENLEEYNHSDAAKLMGDFFLNDLSRGYGQIIRKELDKKETQYVIYKITLELLKLMAPFIPFTTEKLYQDIFKKYERKKSIHLFRWPKLDKKKIDKKLEKEIELANKIISLILACRDKAERGVRWPVKKAIVVSTQTEMKKVVKKYKKMICGRTNLLNISVGGLERIKFNVKANFQRLGPKYGKDVRIISKRLLDTDGEKVVEDLKKKNKFILKVGSKYFELKEEDLVIEEVIPEGYSGHSEGKLGVYLDLDETEKMKVRGFMREIVRKVQALRKSSGLKKKDKIDLQILIDSKLRDLLKDLNNEIRRRVDAKKVSFVSSISFTDKEKFKIRNKKISIGIKKI